MATEYAVAWECALFYENSELKERLLEAVEGTKYGAKCSIGERKEVRPAPVDLGSTACGF